jgi:hypothetical protein
MIRLTFLLTLSVSFISQFALAQSPADKQNLVPTVSPGELKVTPEMWFYEQSMKQYMDPKMAVRARAEFEANQRQRRLAAMRWYGFSNSRPRWSADIYNWDMSPGWASNNSVYPYRWQGIGQPWYMAQPMRPDLRMY